jgi:hypothetical protein
MAVSEVVAVHSANNFRLVAHITLTSTGHQTSHPLDIHMYVDDFQVEDMSSTIEYNPSVPTCFGSIWPDCDVGECFDVLGFSSSWEGFCSGANFDQCACSWVITVSSMWLLNNNQQAATVIVDPLDQVEEFDETNNVLILDLGPIAMATRTWTSIKALYQ